MFPGTMLPALAAIHTFLVALPHGKTSRTSLSPRPAPPPQDKHIYNRGECPPSWALDVGVAGLVVSLELRCPLLMLLSRCLLNLPGLSSESESRERTGVAAMISFFDPTN